MVEKRPIDALRDSGGVMNIGGADDSSAVTDLIPIGDHLYIVKANGIYEVQLADQIDPQRTKIEIPNTEQRVLAYGSDNEIVARTLLTAQTLFRTTFLGSAFDRDRGMTLVLDVLKDLIAMSEMRTSLEAAQAQAVETRASEKIEGRLLRLPAVGNVEDRCDAFGQKAGHIVSALGQIARLFYGHELSSKWIDSLTALTRERYGEEDAFVQFMGSVRPFLLFVLDMRNMIEHPHPDKHIKSQDFSLHSSGLLVPPSVTIMRPECEPAQVTIVALMTGTTAELVTACELLFAYLSSVHAHPPMGLPIQVLELPLEQRRNKHLRFCYGTRDGERVIPVGGG